MQLAVEENSIYILTSTLKILAEVFFTFKKFEEAIFYFNQLVKDTPYLLLFNILIIEAIM